MARKKNKKRVPVKPGTRVPYAEEAGIDPYKLTRYALSFDRCPGKANGFKVLLGIELENWHYLSDQLLERLPTTDATHACTDDPQFIEFTVPIPVDGLNGERRIVWTGWGVDSAHSPWLTTLWARPERA